jgi:hypothetical protein
MIMEIIMADSAAPSVSASGFGSAGNKPNSKINLITHRLTACTFITLFLFIGHSTPTSTFMGRTTLPYSVGSDPAGVKTFSLLIQTVKVPYRD